MNAAFGFRFTFGFAAFFTGFFATFFAGFFAAFFFAAIVALLERKWTIACCARTSTCAICLESKPLSL